MSKELVEVAGMLRGFALNQIVASAARVDLFGAICAGPTSTEALSAAVGLPERSVQMLVAVLTGLDLCRVHDGEVSATGLTPLLAKDGGQMHGQALLCADEYYKTWGELDATLRTGESAFRRVYGTDMWSYLDSNPDALAQFSRTMSAGSDAAADRIIDAYPFGDHTVVVDIGAGDGTFLWRLLTRQPTMRGIAVELPAQAAEARRKLEGAGLDGRGAVLDADAFTDELPESELYVLKGVLHNWADEAAVRLLRALRAASPNGRVLVVERLSGADLSSVTMHGAINSLTMSLLFGAAERTADQYVHLLASAGYSARVEAELDGNMALMSGDPIPAV